MTRFITESKPLNYKRNIEINIKIKPTNYMLLQVRRDMLHSVDKATAVMIPPFIKNRTADVAVR